MSHVEAHIKTKLNDEQFAAAMHIDTSSLIIAGAGSGKTRALTYKIANLIYGHKTPPQQILAVTFTNKAANEMKERIMKLWEEFGKIQNSTEEKVTSTEFWEDDNESIDSFLDVMEQSVTAVGFQGLSPYDLKRIGTFHGIFLKILKEYINEAQPVLEKNFGSNKYSKNFTILDPNDTNSVIKDVLKKLWLKEVFKPKECKGFISKQKNQGITPQIFLDGQWLGSDYDQNMGKVYERYQKNLALSNALDFDDLLLIPFLIFQGNEKILDKWQSQFHYIMVDEAQDTNRIQFELMRMLSWKHGNITLIGDDYQSIYGWRGAIMDNFLNVKKYRPDIQMFKLQINYRSRPHIVAAWSHIIKNNQFQYEKNIKAHRTGDDKIVIFSHRDEMDEAANIIDMVKKMKEDKLESWNEVAILYRTNAQSSPFEQILVQEGIPYKIWGAYKFFERKEIKDIIAYIAHLLNPDSNISLKRILNVPNRKIGKTTVNNLEEASIFGNISLNDVIQDPDSFGVKVTPMAKKWLDEFKKIIHWVRDDLKNLRPSQVIAKLVQSMNYKSYLIKEEWSESLAEEKYENIGQLINMAWKYEETGEEILRSFMEEVSLLTDITENNQGDIDAIKLMTLHASKWLEFPIVFIAGVEDQVFPLANALMEPKLLEEERRLMYVGITRAENHLFLSYANSRMQRWQTKMNPPSRFIDELPEELLKRYDLSGWGGMEWPKEKKYDVFEGDTVKHKLFGTGYVLEIWNKLAIVKFHNPKFGVRKIEMRFLEVM